MRRFASVLLLLVGLLAADAFALTPDEAYAAIPHRRIAFDPAASTLSKPQAEALKRLFALSDQGVVLRVEGMRAVRAGNGAGAARVLAQYDTLLVSLRALPVAPEIAGVRNLVAEAVDDQRRFLAGKRAETYGFASRELASAPDVRQASEKLKRAYDMLLKAFPNEQRRNKDAFFDHLCALDYL